MNLVTSCVDCNLGKSGKTIAQSAPTETDRLRMAQEMQEQRQSVQLARESMMARKERRQDLVEFWCEASGRDDVDSHTITTVFAYLLEYGEAVVFPWIEKASVKCYNDRSMGRYVSGIRRTIKAEEESE